MGSSSWTYLPPPVKARSTEWGTATAASPSLAESWLHWPRDANRRRSLDARARANGEGSHGASRVWAALQDEGAREGSRAAGGVRAPLPIVLLSFEDMSKPGQ
jgi:hypothetical protein